MNTAICRQFTTNPLLSYTEILEKYWGHPSFRALQEDIIHAVAGEKRDVLALLPTGGGKSVCFQVPALAQEGICLVISPLIALMNDQVDNLKSRGIHAYSLGGKFTIGELDRILDECVFGQVKFLYLSPERLQSDLVRERITRMKVNLLAIDEAHCISQWGYDFRPQYLQISEIRKLIPGVPCLALTASATAKVAADIAEKLELMSPVVFRKSFFRDNLSLFVVDTEKKADYLLKVVKKNPGSGLVYVNSRKDAKVLADLLKNNGVSSDHYHAGLSAVERSTKQQDWIAGKTRVMVCTNAFGMGIDKADVRFVVHWGMSSSLEAYYQEAGRAGRDGNRSFAVSLMNPSDLDRLKNAVEEAFPEKEVVKRIYSMLGSYYQLAYGSGLGVYKDFDLATFAAYCKLPPRTVFNGLQILKNDALVDLTESVFQPSRVLFLQNSTKLYEFQVFNPKFDPLIRLILRSYGGMFDEYIKIDEWMLARKLSVTVDSLRAQLRLLAGMQVIDYAEQSDKPQLAFLTERLVENNFHISKAAYEDRKLVMENQLNAVIAYCEEKKACRFERICNYFDEPEIARCGHCDNCLEFFKGQQLSTEEIIKKILELLSEEALTVDELKHHISLRFHEKQVDEGLQWLFGQEQVRRGIAGKIELK
ncbi:MAG: RecQ family ATP-dependent DNA helicase [Bacteroidota bacterium]